MHLHARACARNPDPYTPTRIHTHIYTPLTYHTRACAHATLVPQGGVELHGEDSSWALPVFPLPGKKRGEMTPGACHFDGGRHNVYHRDGLPCNPDQMCALPCTEDQLLAMHCMQLGFLLFCVTPGTLGPSQGATGVFPGSHLVVSECIRRRADKKQHTTWPSLRTACKKYGDGQDAQETPPLVQPVLEPGKMYFISGLTLHGTMFATEGMRVSSGAKDGVGAHLHPRVIMNPKVACTRVTRNQTSKHKPTPLLRCKVHALD